MTLDEFFDALREVRDDYTWYPNGTYGDSQTLRGCRNGVCVCPVTAVHFTKNQKYVSPGNALSAGRVLGLPLGDTTAVIQAADAIHGHDPIIRQRLMEAVGLV